MGQYKSRPKIVCADEWRKKFGDSCAAVRTKLIEDLTLKVGEWTALHHACSQSNAERVAELATEDNVNERTDDGLTGLHLCCVTGGSKGHVECLLRCGAKTSLLSKNYFGAIHLAAYKGDVNLVEAFLEGNADPLLEGFTGVTALHIAAMCGHDEVVSLLLDRGVDVNLRDKVDFSALHHAAFFGHERVVELLLNRSANVNLAGKVGDGPLHGACFNGHMHIVKLLAPVSVREGRPSVDVNAVDGERHTALHVCCRYGHLPLVKYLLQSELGVNPHTANVYGDTPLHFACYQGHTEVARLLVEETGRDSLLKENIFSETPLHCACSNDASVDLIEFLLEQPSMDINIQGRDGHTPLHSACFNGHFTLVEYLLDRGADACVMTYTAEGCEGETPLNWAFEQGYDDIVHLLKLRSRPQEETTAKDNSLPSSAAYISQVALPSPIGRLRSVTKEKSDILLLRTSLDRSFHINLSEIEIIENVGSGSFGRVAKGIYHGTTVAVKKYRAASFTAKSDVDMFCREVSILCRLNHPNVIKFIGACLEEPSQFAIVTQYVGGGSLFSVLHEQNRVLDMSTKVSIGVDVARGMNYLHTLPRPIIHRDLNSHNILLDENGSGMVADFGESRFLKTNQSDEENLTKQPGNLRWMAPEIFTQSTRYSIKADMFSFALCLWELLSGDLPFHQHKPAAAAADMAYRNLRPPLPHTFPRPLCSLIQHGWDEKADKRPTFREALTVLESVLHTTVPNSISSLCTVTTSPSATVTASVTVGDAGSHHRGDIMAVAVSGRVNGHMTEHGPITTTAMQNGITHGVSYSELTKQLQLRTIGNGYVADPLAVHSLHKRQQVADTEGTS